MTDDEPAGEPRWRRAPDALWRRAFDAVIVLPAGVDEPMTLVGSGPQLWELLVEPRTFASLVDALASAFSEDRDVVAADIAPVVERLIAVGAIEPA